MKKFKFALLAFMTALISFAFTACSDDDEVKDVPVTAVTVSPDYISLEDGNYRNTDGYRRPGKCNRNNCFMDQFGR